MKTGIIIQARLGSTRLPGKVLMDLQGKTVLERVVERCRKIKWVDEVIVATPDHEVQYLAAAAGAIPFVGSEDDVLDRYYHAALNRQLDTVVRITADCPLLDPEISTYVVGCFLGAKSADYVSNVHPPTFPDGLDTEVFSFQALEKAHKMAVLPYDREHVTPYIWGQDKIFKLMNLEVGSRCLCRHRWTLDTRIDYIFVNEVYKRLEGRTDIASVLAIIEREPKLRHFAKRKDGCVDC